MVVFYGFPREHRIHLQTSNVVKAFAAVTPRTTAAKRFKNIAKATALIWKVLMIAEKTFRRLNAPALFEEVCQGGEVRRWSGCKQGQPEACRLISFTHLLT
jgi:hypothetical protein